MQSAFISYKSSQIHYSYSGTGNKILLCLHGYGESEQGFRFLEAYLPAGYCIIAIDLPFHGQTQWSDGLNFSITDLLAIVDAIGAARNIVALPVTLLGFSMGGRFVLALLQARPGVVEKAVLLAPDGLKVNFWYWLSTQTYIGNKLFLYTMKHPYWFAGLLNMTNKLQLINKSIYKFTRYFIHDKHERMQLYNRWTCFRTIKPDLSLIKKLIGQHKIPVQLAYGRYDRIILHTRGEKFRAGIESFCTLQVLPAGHQLLQPKHAGVVVDLIQS
jgi:pimeloyl-ACP methyl ester carboxylesterase